VYVYAAVTIVVAQFFESTYSRISIACCIQKLHFIADVFIKMCSEVAFYSRCFFLLLRCIQKLLFIADVFLLRCIQNLHFIADFFY